MIPKTARLNALKGLKKIFVTNQIRRKRKRAKHELSENVMIRTGFAKDYFKIDLFELEKNQRSANSLFF
jgi:hypothetical protein